jgi:hypothetical protein
MKKVKSLLFILTTLFLIGIISAESCSLDISLINQDPYPAIPGDYVKVVFQIEGLANPECGNVNFQVKEEFPFTVDPSNENPIQLRSGTYSRKYSSFYIAPFKLRVSENSLDGDNPIEVAYTMGTSPAEILKEFSIEIEDSRADFEIYIKDYDYNTQTITFEILNIEDVDVQALTLEIPKQDNILIKGANREVVGDLDSNEYTTSDFEATPKDGEIQVKLIYTDSVNVRRELNKTVTFDSSYFTARKADEKKKPYWLFGLLIIVVIWIVWRRIKKAKIKKKKLEQQKHHETHKH